jgi:hypothetical protein
MHCLATALLGMVAAVEGEADKQQAGEPPPTVDNPSTALED